jgi:hypothetical protein
MWAAHNGKDNIVELLLAREDVEINMTNEVKKKEKSANIC